MHVIMAGAYHHQLVCEDSEFEMNARTASPVILFHGGASRVRQIRLQSRAIASGMAALRGTPAGQLQGPVASAPATNPWPLQRPWPARRHIWNICTATALAPKVLTAHSARAQGPSESPDFYGGVGDTRIYEGPHIYVHSPF